MRANHSSFSVSTYNRRAASESKAGPVRLIGSPIIEALIGSAGGSSSMARIGSMPFSTDVAAWRNDSIRASVSGSYSPEKLEWPRCPG